MPRTNALSRSLVVISDLVEQGSSFPQLHSVDDSNLKISGGRADEAVIGGYLERLPRAAVRSGLADRAEIWHHHRGTCIHSMQESPRLTRRAFPISDDRAPFHSDVMMQFIAVHGVPAVLCIWGLGVNEALLEACADSFIIYNSIDAPSLRVPPEVSRHFDLVLTGAEWQSEEVRVRHPGTTTAVLPIGPEFASPDTFFPLAEPKHYDVIYVAAAQPYKRHDLLFAALARSGRPLTALCVIGYGEDAARLRQEAAAMKISVEFVGPPGVPHSEVNQLMNRAHVGIVCGIDDGAPAILTEYMLAGLPVVANAKLRCGLQYIRPETGIVAEPDALEVGIIDALSRSDFTPRQTVLDNWSWPHSIQKLHGLIKFKNMCAVGASVPELLKG